MNYAPIVLFAFNRLDSLMKCVESLKTNEEAQYTDMIVYVDGARPEKPGEDLTVALIQDYVANISGFRSLQYVFSEQHKGLALSIIDGVTQIINQFGSAIVVEDDLIVSKNFLAYMNQGLEKYEHERRVFSICGYSNKVVRPEGFAYDAYFCTRSSSWGWGTWKDRWNSVDWELNDWHIHKQNARQFNKWGGSDCWKLLNDWHEGRKTSWAIRFSYAQFLLDGLSLFPIISKVENNGFDGRGTNSGKWTRFKCVYDESSNKEFIFPVKCELNTYLYKQSLSYHSILIRIWSRLMYLVK